jgi:hypothetical protein
MFVAKGFSFPKEDLFAADAPSKQVVQVSFEQDTPPSNQSA